MNLGQAVAVCLYELATGRAEPAASAENPVATAEGPDPRNAATDLTLRETSPPASSGDLELLAAAVEETMLAANYSPSVMRKANRHDLHLLLRRLVLSQRDARRILGLFRRILWRLKRHAARKEG